MLGKGSVLELHLCLLSVLFEKGVLHREQV